MLKWSERGNPPKSPDVLLFSMLGNASLTKALTSGTQQRCEGDLRVNEFLGMYVVQFLITESYEQNMALKATVLAGFCGDSGVFASKLSSIM